MSSPRNSNTQPQQQEAEEAPEGRAAAMFQAALVLLALGLGAAGLFYPALDIDGSSPASILLVAEDADGACPTTGVLLTFGEDDNEDGVLQDAERDGSTPICDGLRGNAGTPGSDGLNMLMETAHLTAGTTCLDGGMTYSWGLDLDGNGELESGEVVDTSHVCNGAGGNTGTPGSDGHDGVNGTDGADGADGRSALIVSSSPDPGLCPVGLLLHIGMDDGADGTDPDGVLQPEEVDETVRICATDLRSGPLSDLSTGAANSVTSGCDAMNHIGDDLYVAMTDGTHGCELHRLEAGWGQPLLVADVNPGGDAQPGVHLGLHSASDGTMVLFDATGPSGHHDLWALDRTTSAVTRLTDDASGDTVNGDVALVPWLGGHVMSRPGGMGLPWWTDGTAAGTIPLDLHPDFSGGDELRLWSNGAQRMGMDLLVVGADGLWLDAEDGSGDVEPALIHPDGTVQAFDVWPAGSSHPSDGVALDVGIAVVGATPEGRQVIHLDPAQPARQVTQLVRTGSGQPPAFVGTTFGLVALGEHVVFDAVLDGADASLWRWNTSSDDVERLSTTMMNPGDDMAPVEQHGRLWFSCVTMANGSEPCSTDGTVNGTHMHEMTAGWTGSLPRAAVPFLDGVALLADDGTGTALHRLNLSGTSLLHDPYPSGDADAGRYGRLLVDEHRLAFVAHDGSSGHEVHAWCHGEWTDAWIIWP